MSVQEIRQAIHELTNQFQVVLSAIELVEMDLLPDETRKKTRMAKRELRRAMDTLRRIHALVSALAEEERESIQ